MSPKGFFPRKSFVYFLCGLLFAALNFQISDFRPIDLFRAFKRDYNYRFPDESFQRIKKIAPDLSVYSDTFGMSHLLSSRRHYYTEFTHPHVYSKNGNPDLLILVFPVPEKAGGGHAFHNRIETRGTNLVFVQNTAVAYELKEHFSGQTLHGVSIYRKKN
jgi:hypothetical protein